MIGENRLVAFELDAPLSNLEELNLSANELQGLDVTALPALRRLALDNNVLSVIHGITNRKNSLRLSLRCQRTLHPPSFQYLHELECLNFSSNAISTFNTRLNFLNLKALELASSGLHSFPPDFGQKCPNIRTLNLNFNALRDLRPLLKIHRLERLYLAGNRISKLRQTTAALETLGHSLQEMDLRNNPLTVGFYLPQREPLVDKQLVLQNRGGLTTNDTPGTDWEMKCLLPRLDEREDQLARERFDESTKIRRRVYEMLVTNTCQRLRLLDGLEVYREDIRKRDDVWQKLRELGVLKEWAAQA